MPSSPRQPAIFLSHGGGPWPFVEVPFAPPGTYEPLAAYLRSMMASLPAPPRAALVVSAHWEAPLATLMTNPAPPMLYDYYGFAPEAYRLRWPAPGATFLVEQTRALLGAAGFDTAVDPSRGYDHGTFVPMMVALPAADLPILQVSLLASLDPAAHVALGRALAPLRDEGVLLLGSGSSYHDLRGFRRAESTEPSRRFDDWLVDAVARPAAERERLLVAWEQAPAARRCHPREEHLLPLHVMAGAARDDAASVPLRMLALSVHASVVRFG